MVDMYGRWHEEEDYSTYPKEKWCDYDTMAAWIRENGYKPKTSMENLISMMFSFYEIETESKESAYDIVFGNFKGTYTDACKAYVMDNGGFEGFDYEV